MWSELVFYLKLDSCAVHLSSEGSEHQSWWQDQPAVCGLCASRYLAMALVCNMFSDASEFRRVPDISHRKANTEYRMKKEISSLCLYVYMLVKWTSKFILPFWKITQVEEGWLLGSLACACQWWRDLDTHTESQLRRVKSPTVSPEQIQNPTKSKTRN